MKKPTNSAFTVSDRIRKLAKEKGWLDPDKEVEDFVDYWTARGWKANRGVPIVDREAAFRTWLRNGAKWGEGPVQKTGAWAEKLK